jgi:hypothetical protein
MATPPTGPLVFVRGQTETVVPDKNYILNKDTAKVIAEELSCRTWMYNIQVQTKSSKVLIYADYRIPSAFIKDSGGKTLYVGLPAVNDPLNTGENVVFVSDYPVIDIPPTIEIVGFVNKVRPVSGQAWQAPDVAAALKLLAALKRMDDEICPKKPLRAEISTIDISNFEGRSAGPTASHIILKLQDGTPVNWGAALGKATSFFEAPDHEKLNRLYTFYQQNKYTLLGQAKTIELFQPMSGVPSQQ